MGPASGSHVAGRDRAALVDRQACTFPPLPDDAELAEESAEGSKEDELEEDELERDELDDDELELNDKLVEGKLDDDELELDDDELGLDDEGEVDDGELELEDEPRLEDELDESGIVGSCLNGPKSHRNKQDDWGYETT